MYSMKESQGESLDAEWIALILKAKQIGLLPAEIRDFLKEETIKLKQQSLSKEAEGCQKHVVKIKKDLLY